MYPCIHLTSLDFLPIGLGKQVGFCCSHMKSDASDSGILTTRPGYAAVDAICNYYEQLSQKPVKAEVEPGYLLEKLPCA